MAIPRLRVAVSVDGLPEHHDVRRKPATYERILRNIEQCTVNIHWTITRRCCIKSYPRIRSKAFYVACIDRSKWQAIRATRSARQTKPGLEKYMPNL